MVVIVIVLAGVLDFLANWLAAHYLVPFGPFLVPGGTFVFAVSFTIYDYLRRQSGIKATGIAILLGFAVSILYSVVWGGGVGRIAVAGLIAMVFSSTTDIGMQTLTMRFPIWRYVLTSNTVSLFIDTLVFSVIAFGDKPVAVIVSIIAGQYIAKILSTGVSIPLVYGARRVSPRAVANMALAGGQ